MAWFSDTSPPPTHYGPFKILRVLGEGGMGIVYLAEQHEPVHRQVALKVVDFIHSARRRKRFAAECQALARLSHPNIASLHEVGSTDEGHPYLVMELIDGPTITQWCDQERLGLKGRIELFLDACAGVRHAHEKGILHRDIKPDNVLVTEVDGKPVAKVIDFGIASSVGEPLLAHTQFTQNHFVGSPIYMSPEAANPQGQDLDTRSDVYSLGVLLYQLLVGTLPFDSDGLSLTTLLRRLEEEDATLPSSRLTQLDIVHQRRLAKRRGLDPLGHMRQLRGDLDAIVGKAMERDRDRRYGSPADLAADLRRHLKNEPIEARAPSPSYLMGRFVRRRRGVVAAMALLFLALMAGVVARTLEARRANSEARKARTAQIEAEELSRFLVDLFEVADPEQNPGQTLTVQELLDRGATRLESDLEDQPLPRARFLHTIATIQTKLAAFDAAEKLLAEALAIREAELPAHHPEVLKSLNQLGVIYYRNQQRYAESETLLRRTLEGYLSAEPPDPIQLSQAHSNLGNVLFFQDRFDEAEAEYQRSLEIRQQMPGQETDVATSLNNLSSLYQAQGRDAEAAPPLRQAMEIFKRRLGPEHPRFAVSLHNLAGVEKKLKRWREAEDLYREALPILTRTYGRGHPLSLGTRWALGKLLRDANRWREAEVQLRECLEIAEAQAPTPEHPSIAPYLNTLAISLAELHEFESAEALLRRGLEIRRSSQGPDHSTTLILETNIPWVWYRSKQLKRAEHRLREVLDIQNRVLGEDHRQAVFLLYILGMSIADQGRESEAEPLLRRALEIGEKLSTHPLTRGEILHDLGTIIQRQGRDNEAAKVWQRAIQLRRQILADDHPKLRQSLDALARRGREEEP